MASFFVRGLLINLQTSSIDLSSPKIALYILILNSLTNKDSPLALRSEQIKIIGMSIPLIEIASSLILSKYFINPLSELPWATIITFLLSNKSFFRYIIISYMT